MNIIKVASVGIAISCLCGAAFSAEYPPALLGKYAEDCKVALKQEKDMGEWYAVLINKKDATFGQETCTAKKVSGSNIEFTISEKCSIEGDKTNRTSAVYTIDGKTLSVKTGNETSKLTRCN